MVETLSISLAVLLMLAFRAVTHAIEDRSNRLEDTGLVAYRIGHQHGFKLSCLHWTYPWHTDFWFRPWIAESDNLLWYPRAWTRSGAVRKARRWYASGIDIKLHEMDYGPHPELWIGRFIKPGSL